MRAARKSFRGLFPFRLATTSFIYPADYVPNVRRLAGSVDEIELLFFESRALPPAAVLRELAAIGTGTGLTYNVHLPVDVAIGHPDRARRRRDVAILVEVLEAVAALAPTTHTLHIPRGVEPQDSGAWLEGIRSSLSEWIRRGADPGRISIENIDYPLELLAEVLAELGLRVCLDVGHLVLYGHSFAAFHRRFAPRIDIIHLHGATPEREHLAADRLPPALAEELLPVLARFRGTVCLEVFNPADLAASLDWLAARLLG